MKSCGADSRPLVLHPEIFSCTVCNPARQPEASRTREREMDKSSCIILVFWFPRPQCVTYLCAHTVGMHTMHRKRLSGEKKLWDEETMASVT